MSNDKQLKPLSDVQESSLALLNPISDQANSLALHIAGELVAFQQEADELMAQAESAEITNAETYGQGGALVKYARERGKSLEDVRKAITGPLNDYKKRIDALFKPVTESLNKASTDCNQKMTAWVREEERRKRQEEEAARKRAEDEAMRRAEEAEKAGNKDAAEAIIDASTNIAETKAPQRTVVRNEQFGTTAGTRRVWKYSVLNYADIPSDLLVPLGDTSSLKSITRGSVPIVGLNLDKLRQMCDAAGDVDSIDIKGLRVVREIDASVR